MIVRTALFRLSPMLFIVLASVCCNLSTDPGSLHDTPTLELCEQIWNQVQNDVKDACGTGRHANMACYGSHLVTADICPQAGEELRFEEPADTAPLSDFQQINAIVDVERHQYGIALFDVRLRNPPGGTVAGDVVRFVLYGDTQIAPLRDVTLEADGAHTLDDFGAFYFLTGINPTPNECRNLPTGGLMIEAPTGLEVALEINGASVTIGSTVWLEAIPEADMTVNVLEGSVQVTAHGRTVYASSMQAITVPIAPSGSAGWYVASGAPARIPANNKSTITVPSLCDLLLAGNMLIPSSCPPNIQASAPPRPPSALPLPGATAKPSATVPPLPTATVPPTAMWVPSPTFTWVPSPTFTWVPSPTPTCTGISFQHYTSNVTQASPGQSVTISWQLINANTVEVYASTCGILSGCPSGETQRTIFRESGLPQVGQRTVMIPVDYQFPQLIFSLYANGEMNSCTHTSFYLVERKIAIMP